MSGVLSAFTGGAAGVINGAIPNGTAATESTLVISSDGTYICGSNGGDWVTPANATVAAQWQVKVDVTSGSLASGTTGTWLDCSTVPTWTCQDGVAVTATLTISFREKSTTAVRSEQTGLVLTATS